MTFNEVTITNGNRGDSRKNLCITHLFDEIILVYRMRSQFVGEKLEHISFSIRPGAVRRCGSHDSRRRFRVRNANGKHFKIRPFDKFAYSSFQPAPEKYNPAYSNFWHFLPDPPHQTYRIVLQLVRRVSCVYVMRRFHYYYTGGGRHRIRYCRS